MFIKQQIMKGAVKYSLIENEKFSFYLGNINAVNDKKILKDLKITHILNCTDDIENFFPNDFHYKNIPLKDFPNQEILDKFSSAHDFFNLCFEKNGVLFVHCRAGQSRSTSMVISYLMKELGKNLKESIVFLSFKSLFRIMFVFIVQKFIHKLTWDL